MRRHSAGARPWGARPALLVVGCAAAALAACGSPDGNAPATSANLRIDVLGFFAGAHRKALRCRPPGGDVPRPARACAELAAQPGLLRAVGGRPHSCPFGTPAVFVGGDYGGRAVDASFSVCVGGQEAYAGRWQELFGGVVPAGPACGGRALGAIVRDPVSNAELQAAELQLATIKQAERQGGRCATKG